MSSTARKILDHVKGMITGTIITTCELLYCGPRNAVDKTTARLVQKGILLRLARGVFTLPGGKIPSAFEIIKAKAKAFKKIVCNLNTKAKEFVTTGCKSSFDSIEGRLHFKPVCQKKFEKISQMEEPVEKGKHSEVEEKMSGSLKQPRKSATLQELIERTENVLSQTKMRLAQHLVNRFKTENSNVINCALQC